MKIAVLCGGRSSERDVSLSTGIQVARALRETGHDVVLVDACVDFPLDCRPEEVFEKALPIENHAIGAAAPCVKSFFDRASGFFGKNVLEICKSADIVFNALHGDEGENGKLQAVFDLLNICYTGSGAQGCMLAMNKSLSKQLFRTHGIPTPEAVILSESDKCRAAELCEKLGLPCVVKPASLGSSVGVSIVRTNDEFFTALDSAFSLEHTVIVEKYIKGREFAVGIVGSRVLPAIEIIPKHGFYDYKNKYQPGCTVEICPADIDSDTAERMAEATRKVFRVLGLGAYARADFMVDENGIYCLEANTLPGMTPVSLLPQEAAADKLDFPALLEAIIKESLLLRATERRH